MPTRTPSQRRSLVLVFALLLALATPGLLTGETPPTAAATCTTTIAPSDSAGDQLQEAIDGATNGDVICLQAGTYLAANRIIPANLTLTIRGAGQNQTVLDAKGNSRVFTIGSGARILLTRLTITGGIADATSTGTTGGGGIRNEGGRLTLAAVSVKGNRAVRGAGIYNLDGGTVILGMGARVNGNRASEYGGGIYNEDNINDTVILKANAQVHGNKATFHGGGVYNDRGKITLNNDAQVSGNAAVLHNGGGIENFNSGTVTLNDRAQVSGNQAGQNGGGIDTLSADVILNDNALVTKNTAGTTGGGINNNFGSVTLNGNAQVIFNQPNNCTNANC